MENKVAVVSIIVETYEAVEAINALLHEFSDYIIGRMGIPYRAKHINLISVALDAPADTVSALAGKLGNLAGVSVKTAIAGI